VTSPAPVIHQPDLEAWVWAQIGTLGWVNSFAYSADQEWPGWVYRHFVQVDCRAKRKQAAHDLAEQVRQVICALPDTPWAEGVVSYVDPVEGPFWLPDPDGLPRYVTRYEIRVHPLQTAGAITLAAPAARPHRPQGRHHPQEPSS
jgi:hypothetical protein